MATDSDTPLSRRERERRTRRQAMLRAAESVFAEKGYPHATLEEIAERAEFGKGTLYNYFEGGKEEIFFAVLDTIYDELCDLIARSVADAANGTDPRARYHALVVRALAFYHDREDLFVILIKEAYRMCFSHDASKVAYFQRQQERMVNALLPMLQQADENGALRDLPLEAIAHLLIENIDGLIVHRAIMANHPDRPTSCQHQSILDDPEKAATFLTTMLFDGVAAPPSA
ncbi:TetR family transcriptional regulator [Longimonas halophila]|uniref:TetR family transcriptional regulator n=1 Tax=Longimonas halophila TaxID=1469170 RepID=A0A2H3NUZ9_9BACT|nr:TetR/AcrR family transcriptional regulator [Longimonas halophila]PEN08407.1 TetR family transcriptional regulator [Longimonas halophila]